MEHRVCRVVIALTAVLLQVHLSQSQWYLGPHRHIDRQHEVQKRYTSDLDQQLKKAQDNALYLYTIFSASNGGYYKTFIRNMHSMITRNLTNAGRSRREDVKTCRTLFNRELQTIRVTTHKKAAYIADEHNKYIRGPQVMAKMHLIQSETYLDKMRNMLQKCAGTCRTDPRVVSLSKMAESEIKRVNDHMGDVRLLYEDIRKHLELEFRHIWTKAEAKMAIATETLEKCLRDNKMANNIDII